jgi:hypothetical protein
MIAALYSAANIANSLANYVCTAILPNPDLVQSSGINIQPATRTKLLLLWLIILWILYLEASVQDVMGRQSAM